MAQQAVGEKKKRICSSILGKRVIAAFANAENTPHNCLIAWTTHKDAYFVHLKRRTFHKYINGGKYVIQPKRCFVRPKQEPQAWSQVVDSVRSRLEASWDELT